MSDNLDRVNTFKKYRDINNNDTTQNPWKTIE